jgi:hypothetical protein
MKFCAVMLVGLLARIEANDASTARVGKGKYLWIYWHRR